MSLPVGPLFHTVKFMRQSNWFTQSHGIVSTQPDFGHCLCSGHRHHLQRISHPRDPEGHGAGGQGRGEELLGARPLPAGAMPCRRWQPAEQGMSARPDQGGSAPPSPVLPGPNQQFSADLVEAVARCPASVCWSRLPMSIISLFLPSRPCSSPTCTSLLALSATGRSFF